MSGWPVVLLFQIHYRRPLIISNRWRRCSVAIVNRPKGGFPMIRHHTCSNRLRGADFDSKTSEIMGFFAIGFRCLEVSDDCGLSKTMLKKLNRSEEDIAQAYLLGQLSRAEGYPGFGKTLIDEAINKIKEAQDSRMQSSPYRLYRRAHRILSGIWILLRPEESAQESQSDDHASLIIPEASRPHIRDQFPYVLEVLRFEDLPDLLLERTVWLEQ